VPCLVASIVGDLVCKGVGIHHKAYDAPVAFHLTPAILGWTVLASLLFAGASAAFIELTHAIQNLGKGMKGATYLRPVIGGLVVIGMTLAVGNQTYNGLGIPLIASSFHPGGVPPYAFALKILFTAVTLGAGFKGGEVTPLFCIGAALGCTFAGVTGQDPAVFAALGFVAVFASAANTPLACIAMGIELFGGQLAVPLSVACVLAYLVSGHRGIYTSQRVQHPKGSYRPIVEGQTLRSLSEERSLKGNQPVD
jgi:H+/Cl- antiporter ClcA